MSAHKEAAGDYLNAVVIPNEEPAELYVALAQVEATLYAAEQTAELVKQQRLANLMAFISHEFVIFQADRSSFDGPGDMDNVRLAQSQIREGLGLS